MVKVSKADFLRKDAFQFFKTFTCLLLLVWPIILVFIKLVFSYKWIIVDEVITSE